MISAAYKGGITVPGIFRVRSPSMYTEPVGPITRQGGKRNDQDKRSFTRSWSGRADRDRCGMRKRGGVDSSSDGN